MKFNAHEIYDSLKAKGVKGLFHANTVRTSKTFLEQGGLLSRKYIEDNGLIQTPQKSDEIDKKFNIWNDIFFDAINISKYYDRYNLYGPVLFCFNLDMLKLDNQIIVQVSKKNPMHWNDEDKIEDRYFMNKEDFDSNFKTGNKLKDGGCHIIIGTDDGKIPFENLLGIQIDSTNLSFIDKEGKKKFMHEGIIEYYAEDLIKNGIPKEKVFINNDKRLKNLYSQLYQNNNSCYKRLFYK